MKEEPNACPEAGNDYVFDSVISGEDKKFETLQFGKSPANHMNEVMSLPEKLDEKIFIDFQCKNVKPESWSAIGKTENQNCSSIVKVENEIQTNYLNKKSLIILIRKEFNYDNNSRFQEKCQLKLVESEKVKIFDKKTQT
ncbi:uncharacterized protein LOC106655265 [Trichogramma pretiosum]|uniref:uncharacterized protein LOC106655265 n=1 Tax=Trichogramma pretiosum TaxID=7493 RepID=UPI000C71960E|nr:uncharacterized protein LOC106655265 [Trichogramma pretiosum]